MSATLVLRRDPSFDTLQDPFHLPTTMPAQLTCRAASRSVMRAPPPLPPPAALSSQQDWPRGPTAPPPAPAGNEPLVAAAVAAWFKPPTPAPAPSPLPALPAPLPTIATTQPPSSDREAQALADQLEDLLVFTPHPHPGPEDPQLLVHSPPAQALRACPASEAAAVLDRSSSQDDAGMVTPRAGTPLATHQPPPAVPVAASVQQRRQQPAAGQLSPVSQLLLSEGPSLAELLRGPRPLREIALELTRSPCMQPAYSQDLAPVLALLDDDMAAAVVPAQQAQRAVGPAPALCLRSQPSPTLLSVLPAGMPAGCLDSHPLSPSCASGGALSPSKSSGAMIQLVDLHKGQWHQAHSCSEASSGGDGTISSGNTREGSIDSAYRSGFANAAGSQGCTPMLVEDAEEEEEEDAEEVAGGSVYPQPVDAIMSAEGMRRVAAAIACTSHGFALPSVALCALDSMPDALGGEESMEVTIHPASSIASPISVPAFASLAHATRGLGGGLVPAPLPAPVLAQDLPLLTPFVHSQSRAHAPATAAGGGAVGMTHTAAAGPSAPSPAFSRFLELLRCSSCEFEAEGRVLRLRRYLRADAAPHVLDAVLEALLGNTRVEALYIQNFECGMGDAQLERLGEVLRQGRIWAVNVGENFCISRQAWERLCDVLPSTSVGYMYVSEAHLEGTDLKARMRDAIRQNRRVAPPRDPQVIVHVGNMWWNPRLPQAEPFVADAGDNSSRGGASGMDSLPNIYVGSKRGSHDLEDSLEGAVVSSSPLLRRATSHRIGFRGSLVAGASRATLLRPRPAKPREAPACAGGAAPEGLDGSIVMLTRSRAGVILGGPTAGPGEAGGDDDDEDYHVEDDSALSDDDYDDFDGDFCRPRRRHAAPAVAPARTSRRLQERAVPIAAHLPLADQFGAVPASASSRPLAPAPKRLKGETSRDSSSAGAPALLGAAAVLPTKSGGEMEATSETAAAAAAAAAGVAVAAAGRKPAAAAAPARRSAPAGRGARGASTKRGGAGAQRAPRGELKGKPSFSELVESGFMRPGQYRFTVGTQEVAATIEDDGGIRYGNSRFRAISKFALVVLRERNPSRQSCDGWKEVAWNGEKLDMLRLRLQQYIRQQARRGAAPTAA